LKKARPDGDGAMAVSVPKGPDETPEQLEDGWEVSGLAQASLNPKVLAALGQAIENDEHPDFHSLLIARHGQLVFESYYHGYDSTQLHDIRSAGKSFTSTLIGIAIDQGSIPNVDAPILPYFKQYEPHRNVDHWKESIRVQDLLMMMSGLDADDNDPSTPGCENNMLKSDSWIRYSLDLPMREAPGQSWVYAGTNSMLLAGLLESATERPFLDFAIDHLFEPLGIANFAWETSPQGEVAGQGFLSMCARDMLKLGQLFLKGGSWLGQQVVSRQWAEAATSCRVELPNERDAGYGYQWWRISLNLEARSFKCYFASGNGGNKIFVLPSLDMVVGMASSAYGQPYMHTRSHEVLRQVVRAAV
jgi:CubicO group peptidase (beta-lactamase class C family)